MTLSCLFSTLAVSSSHPTVQHMRTHPYALYAARRQANEYRFSNLTTFLHGKLTNYLNPSRENYQRLSNHFRA